MSTKGSKLDVYSEADKAWLIATIIDTNEKQIKIHYLGWSYYHDCWFPKNSQFLAPLNTHTLPIINLSSLPKFSPVWLSEKLILHQRSIIFITESGIYEYDITHDEYHVLTEQYPFEHWQTYALSSYDERNGLLYITNFASTSYYVFDLSNNQFHEKIIHLYPVQTDGCFRHQAIVVHHEKDDDDKASDVLHLIADEGHRPHHTYYNEDREEIIYVETLPVSNGRILGIPHQTRILYLHKQQCFELKTESTREYECKFVKSEIKIPEQLTCLGDKCFIMNIYDSLVAFIDITYNQQKIIFLDLITNKWFESNVQCPIIYPHSRLIDGKDNFVYFMRPSPHSCMFKINWAHIIPKELCKHYQAIIYKNLIYGFIGNIEKRHNLYYNVPFYLKELILMYYPCFLYFSC